MFVVVNKQQLFGVSSQNFTNNTIDGMMIPFSTEQAFVDFFKLESVSFASVP